MVHVNAFRAPHEQTDDGVHLSIPVAPAAIPIHADINLDVEVGPYFDAVQGEDDYDSDDESNCPWEPEPLPEPLAQTGTIPETLQMTEQQLAGIRQYWCKGYLPRPSKLLLVPNPSLPPSPEQNTTEETTMEASGNPPPAGEMKESQLMLLNNAALRDLLKQKNQSTNGNKQVLIQRLLSGESRRAVLRTRNNNTEEEDIVEQLSSFRVFLLVQSGGSWYLLQKLLPK
jgi:hypothetical protein